MRISLLSVLRPFAALGVAAFIVFCGWSFVAYRATPEARAALQGDDWTIVERREGYWLFQAKPSASDVGLLFFPGALVGPAAYAPLAREVAQRGPRGAAPATRSAGHSRGGGVAARMVLRDPSNIAGLVLIGTSHPRDLNLAHLLLPVTRVYGTRDTVVGPDTRQQTSSNLPPATRMVEIDGGNHSQFGYYGFQPGDSAATITRETQQRLTRQALTDALDAARFSFSGKRS